MNTKNERAKSAESRPALPPTRLRRFRIQKLEERIAPAKGGQTKGHGNLTHGPGPCSGS